MRPLFSYELLALWFKSFYSWASSIAELLSVKYTSCNEQSKIFYRATIKSNLKTVFVHSLLREMAGWACIGPFSVQSFDPIRCPPRAVFGMSFGLILHTPEPITSASSQGLSALLSYFIRLASAPAQCRIRLHPCLSYTLCSWLKFPAG